MRFTHHSRKDSAAICLLVHGFPNNSELWRDQIDVLAAKFEVITVDLPGADVQRVRPGDQRFENIVSKMKDYLERLNSNERPVYVIGHDIGCFFVETLAQEMSPVKGQILLNGKSVRHFVADLTQGMQILKSSYVWFLQIPGVVGFVRRYLNNAASGAAYKLAGVPSDIRSRLLSVGGFRDAEIYRPLVREAVRVALKNKRQRHKNIPTLLVQSTRDPFLVASKHHSVGRHYGNAAEIVTAGSTHWSPVTDSDVINQKILNQLNTWEARYEN